MPAIALAQGADGAVRVDEFASAILQVVLAIVSAFVPILVAWIAGTLRMNQKQKEALEDAAASLNNAFRLVSEDAIERYAKNVTIHIANPWVRGVVGYVLEQSPEFVRLAKKQGFNERNIANWVGSALGVTPDDDKEPSQENLRSLVVDPKGAFRNAGGLL